MKKIRYTVLPKKSCNPCDAAHRHTRTIIVRRVNKIKGQAADSGACLIVIMKHLKEPGSLQALPFGAV